MKQIIRTQSYRDDLDAIEAFIAQDRPQAGVDMWLHLDDQVQQLADQVFTCRPGFVTGTVELVAHPNYIVILEEDATTITALNVVHARKKYPSI